MQKYMLPRCRREHTPHFNWLSLLPRRLIPLRALKPSSRSRTHSIQSLTPGKAWRRASGIGSSHSAHSVALSPTGVRLAFSRSNSSLMDASICSDTAPSRAHPPATVQSSQINRQIPIFSWPQISRGSPWRCQGRGLAPKQQHVKERPFLLLPLPTLPSSSLSHPPVHASAFEAFRTPEPRSGGSAHD